MKKKKTLKIIAVISGIAAVAAYSSESIFVNLVKMAIAGSLNIHSSEAAAVGIIGGADGPTAIYLSSGTFTLMKNVMAGIFLLISAFCAFQLKKGEKL